MRFLVDAQLPRRLSLRLGDAGHDAIHTLDLHAANRTSDSEIVAVAEREDRVVVTKDEDFVNSFLTASKPARLLLVSTGNIRNADLEAIFVPAIPALVAAFQTHRYVELSRTAIIIHS